MKDESFLLFFVGHYSTFRIAIIRFIGSSQSHKGIIQMHLNYPFMAWPGRH